MMDSTKNNFFEGQRKKYHENIRFIRISDPQKIIMRYQVYHEYQKTENHAKITRNAPKIGPPQVPLSLFVIVPHCSTMFVIVRHFSTLFDIVRHIPRSIPSVQCRGNSYWTALIHCLGWHWDGNPLLRRQTTKQNFFNFHPEYKSEFKWLTHDIKISRQTH